MSYDFKIIDNFTLKYLEKCETLSSYANFYCQNGFAKKQSSGSVLLK